MSDTEKACPVGGVSPEPGKSDKQLAGSSLSAGVHGPMIWHTHHAVSHWTLQVGFPGLIGVNWD